MMEDYVYRKLLIKKCNSLFDGSKPQSVIIINLPRKGLVDPEEIRKVFYEILTDNPIDGYEIEDKRTETQLGASGCTQEVGIAIALGVAGNVATTVIKQLWDWGTKQLFNKPFSGTLEDYKSLAKKLIISTFSIEGDLEITAISREESKFEFSTKDTQKLEYKVSFTFGGEVIKLERCL